MDGRTAIIAGRGKLPTYLAASDPDLVFVTFAGLEVALPEGQDGFVARFDRLGELFSGLRRHQVERIVFAGGMSRPDLNPMRFDTKTMRLAPRLMKAFQKGDDRLLREVAAVFEEEGFTVTGAAEIAPEITLEAGTAWGARVPKGALADADQARRVLAALGPLDVGQAAVCGGGHMLGIETFQGTDFMLHSVGRTHERLMKSGAVLVKMPKPGQDLRIDMPAIGPSTVDAAADAGLTGIDIAAGRVIVLEQDEVRRRLGARGLFLVAR